MMKQHRFLLIGCLRDDPWRRIIEKVSTSLGTLQFVREVDALKLMIHNDYDVIMIDAANVEDVTLLISTVKIRKPTAKVLVATDSPTWELAREAYRAGAIDYIRKSNSEEEVLSELQATVDKLQPYNGK